MTHDAPRDALDRVLERIARACSRAGRDPATVRLVAVSKSFQAARVRELLDCGQHLFGENRVQEALAKIPEVGPRAIWHLIGPLQRNKVRHTVGAFELIHSVDDGRLAREIAERAAARAVRQAVLIQLNLAGEATKSGLDTEGLWPLLDEIAGLEQVDLRGLMTLPPPAGDEPEQSRRWFGRLRELRDEASRRSGLSLPDLSMGTSDDFEVAVEEGATLVRVGRAIFGARETVG